jgi:cell division protein FtsQ
MRKVLKILVWLGIAAWFAVIMGFVSAKSEQVLCNRVELILDDTVHNCFVNEADIRSILEKSGARLHGYPLCQINTRDLEQRIEENRYIRNAEVSKDVSGRLEVRIEQRVPLVRIIPDGQRGYYLDTEGKVLPLSDRFTPHVLLVTGHLPGPDDGSKQKVDMEELFRFCSFIVGDEFWNDQVVQLYVDRRGELEMIPRVGAHQILMGGLDNWGKKIRNLELLYGQGLPLYGWNNYSIINLKYTNQVICTKR